MANGFARRFFGSLAGAALFLGLPGALPLSPRSPGPAWWEIRLSVTVKGAYTVKGGGAPVSGEFTCRARWEGTLERDGNDFFLYHLRSEVPEWSLVEKASPPKGESLLVASDSSERPLLRLNYILREGRDLRLDYEFREVSIPLHASPAKGSLEFPRSSGPGPLSPGSSYGDFVSRGTSRVVIPESDLERRVSERTFSWDWQREKRVAKDSGTFLITQRHVVEAVVTLVAH